jgi:hypothetical protein
VRIERRFESGRIRTVAAPLIDAVTQRFEELGEIRRGRRSLVVHGPEG